MFNWRAIIFAFPFACIMGYWTYKDIKEIIARKKRYEEKIKNLKRENIYIDMSKVEYDMLRSLARKEKYESEKDYIRLCIKNLKDEEEECKIINYEV